jgi:hypothetical protein
MTNPNSKMSRKEYEAHLNDKIRLLEKENATLKDRLNMGDMSLAELQRLGEQNHDRVIHHFKNLPVNYAMAVVLWNNAQLYKQHEFCAWLLAEKD